MTTSAHGDGPAASDAPTDGTANSVFGRARMLRRLRSERFDVLVIGGGITGVGVALDAASRGLSTALVEADDFASGTSSKSSKLVHGGLRYLQNGDVRLVYEALRERKRLRHNAPHLVKILPFLLPILTKDGLLPRRVARALGTAMWMYDLTGGWRIGKFHKRLKADAAHAHVPTMDRDKIAGGYLYFDATVDDARLVVSVARTAAAHGAVIANRCRVVGLERTAGGKVGGASVDTGDGVITVSASVVVSATGVWADDIREFEEGGEARQMGRGEARQIGRGEARQIGRGEARQFGRDRPDSIRPAKGVHITVPWSKVRNDIAAVIPVPREKRSLFVVPWGERPDGTFEYSYIGTTDTDYTGRLDDPPCTADDIAYVLGALNAALTTSVTPDEITGVWAGLRPLVRSAESARTADLSRRHRVTTGPGGVVAITGGKLTTYREMAQDTVDEVASILGRRAKCRTKSLRLVGADGFRDAEAGTRDAHLGNRYGTERVGIDALVAADPALREPLVPGLPYERAEAIYAVRHEMATTLVDVLTRRTRAHLLDRSATLEAAPAVAALIAPELGWDDTEAKRHVEEYADLVAQEQADASR